MLEAIKTAFSPQNDQKVLDPLKQLGNREIEILKSKGYDLDFLKQVMPQGGLNFDEEYVTYGNGYSRCVTVYHYTKILRFLVGQSHEQSSYSGHTRC